ncbi:hypothetical protein [Streptomyces sp. XC 2026]|uniref:hypothetical protein n=1 Tax=Streptomyces sp. XC 2026 TaxID=2782004 RepID=UPI001906D36A|nr:hypothetical protein [Streptomyces sp. XC 2026]QQN77164.1 hypothetical protein IPZ77_06655 [Streptomyces sp. XC 2026]
MALRFIAKDPNSRDGQCPSAWVDEQSGELIIQGWKADEEMLGECLKAGTIPDNEAVVRLPARMVPVIREACDVSEAL